MSAGHGYEVQEKLSFTLLSIKGLVQFSKFHLFPK
jgi:hypothetical protein